MSSILKALKKVEHDKKVCRPEQLGIDARILQEKSQSRLSRSAVILIAASLFVCGSGTMYFYLKHGQTDRMPLTQTPIIESEKRIPVPITPANTGGIQQSTIAVQKPTQHTAAPSFQKKDPAAPPRSPRPERKQPTLPASESRPVSTPAVPMNATNRPTLTVNGIAFQEGGNDNMAIINGSAVSSGAVIEGVKVEDILKDRVRFIQNGEKFEILLNKSNR